MYGMFLYGQYEDISISPPSVVEVERVVYVGGSHEQPNKQFQFPSIQVKLLRKDEEKFAIIVKSVEEF
jgi:hypothetical protein